MFSITKSSSLIRKIWKQCLNAGPFLPLYRIVGSSDNCSLFFNFVWIFLISSSFLTFISSNKMVTPSSLLANLTVHLEPRFGAIFFLSVFLERKNLKQMKRFFLIYSKRALKIKNFPLILLGNTQPIQSLKFHRQFGKKHRFLTFSRA